MWGAGTKTRKSAAAPLAVCCGIIICVCGTRSRSHHHSLVASGSPSHWPLFARLDQSATTTARSGPRDLCGGGEPRAAAGRPRGLALHAALDLAGHHHEGLLDVGGVLCRSLEELDPERVRERLVQKIKINHDHF